MYKGKDLPGFLRKFNSEETCQQYLFNLKWKNGYRCRKCGCSDSTKGATKFHMRCKKCLYDESPIANTIFKNMKLPLRKMFAMAFRIYLSKKGCSCLALASEFKINIKTAFYFKRKLQVAVEKGLRPSQDETVISIFRTMDGINLTFRGEGLNGLQQVKLLIGKTKSGQFRLAPGMQVIHLQSSKDLTPSDLFQGHYVSEGKDMMIWHLKSWITGIHHHCSMRYLNGYVAEYLFRFNHRRNQKLLWHRLMKLAVLTHNHVS